MLAPSQFMQPAPVDKREPAYSRLFECVVAVAGFLAAVMACVTLLLGVLFVGASLDMLADPSPMLAFSPQQSEALRWANVGGGWWLLSGMLLKAYRPLLGWTTIALGIAAWAGALGLLLRVGPVATASLGLCFVLTPVWSAWIGALALKSRPLGRRVIDIGPPNG